jgi:hypothetical protein
VGITGAFVPCHRVEIRQRKDPIYGGIGQMIGGLAQTVVEHLVLIAEGDEANPHTVSLALIEHASARARYQ